jgi:glycosyltransferase involved in cell wall biosynthesis
LITAIHRLQQRGQKVAITFHAVRSLPALNEQFKRFASKLKDVDLLIVHTEADRGYLSKLGLTRHVRRLPHGQIRFEPHDKGSLRSALGLTGSPILATFGFFLPHKGILELVQAVAQVRRSYPDLLLLVVSSLYQSLESERYFQICQEEVKRLGLSRQVIFFTDFLPFDEIAPLLQSADLIVMPYNASRESSSAAVRFALAAERPVLVTSLPIFSEFDSEVLRVPTAEVSDLETGILKALSNPDGAEKTVQRARDYLKERSWDQIATQYVSFLSEMGGSFRDYKQRGSR